MFRPAKVEEDFLSAYIQSPHVGDPGRAASSHSSKFDGSAILNLPHPLSKSLQVLSNAHTILETLRSRLSSTSIVMRPFAVRLMAQEAVLWATLESFAATYSPRDLPGDRRSSDLAVISTHLWEMIDTRSTTKEIDIASLLSSSTPRPFTLEIAASIRSARSDFEYQRLVYGGLLTFLSRSIGVQDHRDPRLRAWLVWLVVDIRGFDALYHVEVWRAWLFPQSRCLTKRLWTKNPSLDDMLPLIGVLSEATTLSSHPASALSLLSLRTCTDAEQERSRESGDLFTSTLRQALKWRVEVPVPGTIPFNPPNASQITRALALSSALIGIYRHTLWLEAHTVNCLLALQIYHAMTTLHQMSKASQRSCGMASTWIC